MKQIQTLIIGAGPTGLGAAWACERSGLPYWLVEAADGPGGLARTVFKDGYRWDLGGHVIHSHFPDFDTAIRDSGTPLVDVRRTGTVLFGPDTFISVPVQQQLDILPVDIRPGHPANNLAEYFRNEMGEALCETFFFPFNRKMWAHPLDQVDHRWTSHRSGSQQANVPRVGLKKPAGAIEVFPYPEAGSGSVWDRVARRLPAHAQQYRVRLTGLDPHAKRAAFGDASEIKYERLISSIPLDQLCALVGDPHLAALSRRLRHTEVDIFGFGFRHPIPPALVGKTYIYAADAAVPWYRATVLSNYSARMAPDGCWSVLFECSRSPLASTKSQGELRDSCLDSFGRLGVDPANVDKQWEHSLEYGYPVPLLGRDEQLREIHSLLERCDIFSRGRFGGWRYESCNQDYSFAQGVEAVMTGGSEVLWSPENF